MKYHIFNQTRFDLALYLDTDLIVHRPLDDFFVKRPSNFLHGFVPKACEKCPAIGSKGGVHLNTGVMLIRPLKSVFEWMLNSLSTATNCEQGEQGEIQAQMNGFVSEQAAAGISWTTDCFNQSWNCKMDMIIPWNKPWIPCWCSNYKVWKPHIMHWSGNTKPWKDWWDEKAKKPLGKLPDLQKRSV